MTSYIRPTIVIVPTDTGVSCLFSVSIKSHVSCSFAQHGRASLFCKDSVKTSIEELFQTEVSAHTSLTSYLRLLKQYIYADDKKQLKAVTVCIPDHVGYSLGFKQPWMLKRKQSPTVVLLKLCTITGSIYFR